MNGFKAYLKENHFASMPGDYLHSETHNHLLEHGFEHGGSYDRGNHIEHQYRHPIPNGPAWHAYMGDEDPAPDNAEEHPAHLAQEGMKKMGWKREPLHDTDHEAGDHSITTEAYSHPSGAAAHHKYDYEDDEGNQHHSMVLRTLK